MRKNQKKAMRKMQHLEDVRPWSVAAERPEAPARTFSDDEKLLRKLFPTNADRVLKFFSK